ncbi:MAG: Fic family protein [Alphaproteobacteria bacterium]|nr:Fic family protein [Alphaproteobacteria bacterium]
MYDAVPDPYCYPGTTVLKNRPGLKSQKSLDRFEAAITAERAEEPLPAGRFSAAHYRAIHRHLFQDVYSWAGRYRTVRIARGGSAFCYPEYISREMNSLFADLARERFLKGLDRKKFAAAAAGFLAALNAIHPFREGNGRTQTTFLALLAHRAGHPLDLERLRPKTFLAAMIASFAGNEEPLRREVYRLTPS